MAAKYEIVKILADKLDLSPREIDVLQKELSLLFTVSRDVGAHIGPGGVIHNIHTTNVLLDTKDGVTVRGPNGEPTIHLDKTGNAFFGSDVREAPTTAFSIFSIDQKYNSEEMGKGDVLMGDNTSGKANLLWDASTGRLNFRGGTTTHAYVGTDGRIYAGSGNIIIDATSIRSGNYSAGVSGFSINPAGDAEFNNIIARGEFHSSVFVKNLVDARAGSMMVSKSAGVLAADMTVPTSGTWTMVIKDPPGGGFLFANSDICVVRQYFGGSLVVLYFTVSSRVDNGDGTQSYTCTYGDGDRTVQRVYTAGNGVVDLGVSGNGYLFMSADDGNAPFYSVRTWATNPWTVGNVTERARLGNMRNAFGTGANNRFGFGVGDFSTGNYLSYNAEGANAFVLKAANGIVSMDASGISVNVSTISSSQRAYRFMDGITEVGFVGANNASTNAEMIIQINSGLDKQVGHVINVLADAGKQGGATSRVSQGGTTKAEMDLRANPDGSAIARIKPGLVVGTGGPISIGSDNLLVIGDIYTEPWTDYSATSTVVGFSSTTTKEIYYKKIGKMVFVAFSIFGTSNSTSFTFTVPFAFTSAPNFGLRQVGYSRDNGGAFQPGAIQMNAGGSTIILNHTLNSGAYTASGAKAFMGNFWYEAA